MVDPIGNEGLLSSGCIALRVLVRLSCSKTILDSSLTWEEVAQFMIRVSNNFNEKVPSEPLSPLFQHGQAKVCLRLPV